MINDDGTRDGLFSSEAGNAPRKGASRQYVMYFGRMTLKAAGAPVMMYRLVISLVGFLLGAAVTSNSATLVWTNSAGGVWNVATNWSPNQIPTAADQALITNGGTYTVTVGVNSTMASLTLGGPAGVQTLQLAGGTMNLGAASLLPNGRFRWSDGTLNGVLTIA